MIPDLLDIEGTPWRLLPPGIHPSSLREIEVTFASNPHRLDLFHGLVNGLESLKRAGCIHVYLDGSYVTGKPFPNDYDACWDPACVSNSLLDPVLLDFSNRRLAQKRKYKGEFFPFGIKANKQSIFLDFFQIDKYTGKQKGILLIDLSKEFV